MQPSPATQSRTREPRPLFKRITDPWDREEDDYYFLVFVALSGMLCFVLPLILLPLYAISRFRVLMRMTLLDFWIFSIVAGNWWAYWYSRTDEAWTLWIVLGEGIATMMLGAAWSIRTVESLELKNARRGLVFLCGTLVGPITFFGLAGNLLIASFIREAAHTRNYEYTEDHTGWESQNLSILAFGILAVYLWVQISSWNEQAKACRKGATKDKLRSDAIDRIDARRNEKEAKKRRREEHAQLLLQRKLKKTASSTKKPTSQI